MIFFDSLRKLKKELKTTDADMSFVKEWQKTYNKVRKQSAFLEREYTLAHMELEHLMSCLEEMEQQFVLDKERNNWEMYGKELETHPYQFHQEFLINETDEEFHLIYQTILELTKKETETKNERLLLQSEVENLMAITKEALEKEFPDFRELAYYYLGHSDEELSAMSHREKLFFVKNIYEDEFYHPMMQLLESSLGTKRAKQIMEVELWIL